MLFLPLLNEHEVIHGRFVFLNNQFSKPYYHKVFQEIQPTLPYYMAVRLTRKKRRTTRKYGFVMVTQRHCPVNKGNLRKRAPQVIEYERVFTV